MVEKIVDSMCLSTDPSRVDAYSLALFSEGVVEKFLVPASTFARAFQESGRFSLLDLQDPEADAPAVAVPTLGEQLMRDQALQLDGDRRAQYALEILRLDKPDVSLALRGAAEKVLMDLLSSAE